MGMTFENLVRFELARVTGLDTSPPKARIVIRCAFHNDTNPSLSVALASPYTGGFKCYACGASSKELGGWDALADKLGMTKRSGATGTVTERKPVRIPSKKMAVSKGDEDADARAELSEGMTIKQLMEGFTPVPVVSWRPIKGRDSWRGFDSFMLRLLKGYHCTDDWGRECTVLPVHVSGDLVGGIKCKNVTDGPKDRFKYLNFPGDWVKTHGLFGYDLSARIMKASGQRDLFVCEGQRSAMALLRLGVPAVAILGVHNWSEEKLHLLLGLAPDRIFTAFDGDEAGRKANARVLPGFKGYTWRKRIDLPDGFDPFDLAVEHPKYWRAFFQKYSIQPVDLRLL